LKFLHSLNNKSVEISNNKLNPSNFYKNKIYKRGTIVELNKTQIIVQFQDSSRKSGVKQFVYRSLLNIRWIKSMPKISNTKILWGLMLFVISSLISYNCKESTDVVDGNGPPPDSLVTTISGQVINYLTGSPLDSSTIRILGGEDMIFLTTDTQGKFETEISLTSNTNLLLITSKSGFIGDTTDLFAEAGSEVKVPLIELVPENSGTIPSGDPVSIWLLSLSATTIGVKESGSEETARLVFVVQDSAGISIDLNHSVDVNFKFGSSPGGGEMLGPNTVKTNNAGEAVVNLTSGTKAGAVQIVAEIQLGTKKITSLPVAISIHGGLPDNNHFSIAPALLNFPGYNIYGLTDEIVAYVGDKYGNPVRPQTSVYFTTTGGIIEGSTLTNAQGIGSVNLISAAPTPPFDLLLGDGFGTITASTIDETSTTISKETIVLFSGIPRITDVNPASIDIPDGGSQLFTYTVSDQNGNPLAGGTSIAVTAKGNDVDTQGDVNFQLPDTQSKAWTHFNFVIYDTGDSTLVRPVSVTIKVDGPNGKASLSLYGTSE